MDKEEKQKIEKEYNALLPENWDDIILVSHNKNLVKNSLINSYICIETKWLKAIQKYLEQENFELQYLMIAEYPLNEKGYIYNSTNYLEDLIGKGVLVLDILYFPIKYHITSRSSIKKQEAYQRLIENCKGIRKKNWMKYQGWFLRIPLYFSHY